jgi:hypothetical protein
MRKGGSARREPIVQPERLDAAVDELIALGRERGEQLRRQRSEPPSAATEDKADIERRLRTDLKNALTEVGAYEDDQLVQVAWEALAALGVTDVVKRVLTEDLSDAENQLHDPALATQGRGRLRRFVFSTRVEWPSSTEREGGGD